MVRDPLQPHPVALGHDRVTDLSVNPETGMRVTDGESGVVDFFYQEFVPPEGGAASAPSVGERPAEEVRNQLF